MTSLPTSPEPLHASRAIDDLHRGSALEWRWVLQWLREDDVIDAAEAQRVYARCSTAESSQHPLVRLASVGITRAGDGAPLDIEALTAFVARAWATSVLTR